MAKGEEFGGYLGKDDGVKSRTVIYKQHPDICVFMFQMSQGKMQGSGNGVLCRPFGTVGGLVWTRTSLSKHFMAMGINAMGQ